MCGMRWSFSKRVVTALIVLAVAGCGSDGVDSVEWMVMGTIAKVSFKSGGEKCVPLDETARREICAEVREVYGMVDDKLSIWNPESEISHYTSIDAVSLEVRPCYEAAFRLQKETGGAFNPFWRGEGAGPDLGAIAKGFAVDLAFEQIRQDVGGGAVLLDLGGNLKVVSGEWRTGIRDPFRRGGVADVIVLTNGMACATSGEYERGKHIHDGRTGAPVENDVASVTVVHPTSAMLADGLSTTLFVLGREKGDAFLKAHYPEATAYWVMMPASR